MTIYYRPITPIYIEIDGIGRVYSTDEVFTDDEPAVVRYPSAFVALGDFLSKVPGEGIIDGPVEQATAAPGEKRRLRQPG